MRLAPIAASITLALASASGCIGTTGGAVIDFPFAAAGGASAVSGQPYTFQTDRGWNVTLTQATLHLGAIYLSETAPVSGAQTTSCILPGTYVAQVTTGMDVDLLSPAPQRFPALAHGTTLPAVTGQVWLTGGPIDTASDPTPILKVTGSATLGGTSIDFTAAITISTNRLAASGTSVGSNTICKQRIVTPIATPGVTIQTSGGLLLRIDPRYLFTNVDFSALGHLSSGYGFSDEPSQIDPTSPLYYSQPSANLYQNLHGGGSLYVFAWDSDL